MDSDTDSRYRKHIGTRYRNSDTRSEDRRPHGRPHTGVGLGFMKPDFAKSRRLLNLADPFRSTLTITFLDTRILKDSQGKLTTDIYTKPTDCNNLLCYDSCHPKSTRDSLPRSQFKRVTRIVSDSAIRESRLQEMSDRFKSRNYPSTLLATEMTRALTDTEMNIPTTKPPRLPFVHDYHPSMKKVHNLIHKHWPLLTKAYPNITTLKNPPLIPNEKSFVSVSLSFFSGGRKDKALKIYVILDDQCNRSQAKSIFFDNFNIVGPGSAYSLRTCSGTVETAGRKATGYKLEFIDGQTSLSLSTILECNQIPDNRSEIRSLEVATHHPHLKRIAHLIPELDPEAPIAILLGRDILRVHNTREYINGFQNAPYTQRLDLGWVIIGDVCLGGAHELASVNSILTSILENGHLSLFQPCHNSLLVKELPSSTPLPCPFSVPTNEEHAC
ncbi:unnamed protein product [Ranitomeya imitator]|uniref:Helix-turn-helix domain-containing protein n=1 Tax=Ranitomeya imitator TaxID=111125 RepID=A0ABN9L8U9_9NEOB|nr:unnamed protein product [Ranitomeya imitator]